MRAVVGRCENFLHSSELPDRESPIGQRRGRSLPESHPPARTGRALMKPVKDGDLRTAVPAGKGKAPEGTRASRSGPDGVGEWGMTGAAPAKKSPSSALGLPRATAKPRISQGRTSQLNAPGYSVFRQHEKPQRMQAPGLNGPSGGMGLGGLRGSAPTKPARPA
jgi:hypothetical protein